MIDVNLKVYVKMRATELSIFELPFATRLQEKRLSEVNINNINDLIETIKSQRNGC